MIKISFFCVVLLVFFVASLLIVNGMPFTSLHGWSFSLALALFLAGVVTKSFFRSGI